MDAISYTEARRRLAATMDQVCSDRQPVIITRQRAESVVLVSLRDYEAMEETAYLLRSPANARRLVEAIEQLDGGGGQERELVDEADLQ